MLMLIIIAIIIITITIITTIIITIISIIIQSLLGFSTSRRILRFPRYVLSLPVM